MERECIKELWLERTDELHNTFMDDWCLLNGFGIDVSFEDFPSTETY